MAGEGRDIITLGMPKARMLLIESRERSHGSTARMACGFAVGGAMGEVKT